VRAGRRPDPFSGAANPASYGPRPATERAIAELESVIGDGSQALVLTGPSGIGKTLVLRVLGERLAGRFVALYLPYPRLRFEDICAWVLESLRNAPVSSVDQFDGFVVRCADRGVGVLLLIDEAQELPIQTIRALEERLAKFGPALRVVCAATVAGQLPPHLAGAGWREVPLREPMSEEDTLQLLNNRLARSGDPSADRFNFRAQLAKAIHSQAEGNPRRVLALAGRAWFDQIVRGRGVDPQPASAEPAAAAAPSVPASPATPAAPAAPPALREFPEVVRPRGPEARAASVRAGAASMRAGLAEIGAGVLGAARVRTRALAAGVSASARAVRDGMSAFLRAIRDTLLAGARAVRDGVSALVRGVRDALLVLARGLGDGTSALVRGGRDALLAGARALHDGASALGRGAHYALLAVARGLRRSAAGLGHGALGLLRLLRQTPRSVVAAGAGMVLGGAIAVGFFTLRPEPPRQLLGRAATFLEPQPAPAPPLMEPSAEPEPVAVEPAPPASVAALPEVSPPGPMVAPSEGIVAEVPAPPVEEPARAAIAAPELAAPPAVESLALEAESAPVATAPGVAVSEPEPAAPDGGVEPAAMAGRAVDPAPAPVLGAPTAQPIADVAPAIVAAKPAEPAPEVVEAAALQTPTVEPEPAAQAARWEPDPGLQAAPAESPTVAPAPAPVQVESPASEAASVPPAAAAAPSVSVNVNATPWAMIEVDGREVGETPLADLVLSEGEHRFVARFPDGRRTERLIEVSEQNRHVLFE